VGWEWKRFRQAFVYVAAQVIRRSRRIVLRLSAAHRWYQLFVAALRRRPRRGGRDDHRERGRPRQHTQHLMTLTRRASDNQQRVSTQRSRTA